MTLANPGHCLAPVTFPAVPQCPLPSDEGTEVGSLQDHQESLKSWLQAGTDPVSLPARILTQLSPHPCPQHPPAQWDTCHLQMGPSLVALTPQHPQEPPAVLQSHSPVRLSLDLPCTGGLPSLPAPCRARPSQQPQSPLPAHPLVFLDSVSPLSLPHHELFNSQEQGAVAWAGVWGTLG